MSSATPSCSSPTKSRNCSSLPLPIPPTLPKTPKKRDPTTVTGLTPNARGSSVKQRQDGDTDRVDKYAREDYDGYVREDLSCRVFVDYGVFMEYVLHVPKDWRIKWKPALDAVKADANFKEYHQEYCGLCSQSGTLESAFYPPLADTANAVLDVVSRSNFDDIPSEKRQYYHVNDPNRIKGGVMNKNGLSPDLVLLHQNRPRPQQKESVHWANPLHALEVKPNDNVICDGKYMPRLVVDGIDPIESHAAPPTKLRYRAKQRDPPTTPAPSSLLTTSQSVSKSTAASTSRKRPADGSSAANPRAAKKSKTVSVSLQVPDNGASVQVEGEGEVSPPPEPELRQQVEPALQVCRYLLEMFSVPLFRSHATVSLVDRDRLQLYHANRSVILVSSAINFSTDDGKDKLIATIIAFHRLSLAQNGILTTIVPKNTKLLSKTVFRGKDRVVQKGNELLFLKNATREQFKVKLADVVSCDPAMVGRSTLVLNATSSKWDGPLVIKISWPTSGRVSETDFIRNATKMAKGDCAWAAQHLPKVHYSEDVVFDTDSTLASVARLFEIAEFVNGNYVYERRTLRIIIQERLYPLKSLRNVRDIGQVFLDVACIHRWLCDKPGILHRDLSFNNIMYRLVEDKVYGVLADYDLSSWMNSMNPDYTKTSRQRTGTPPYMAQELLKGTSPLHLYRHDIESLFYVMLLTAARHTIGTPKGEKEPRVLMRGSTKLPYDQWFDQPDYHTLGSLKHSFLLGRDHIGLSPDFEDFRPWLEDIQNSFSDGFALQPKNRAPQEWRKAKPAPVQFDDETLGGCLDYAAVLEAVPHLKGALEGLIIRYPKNPSVPAPPTSDGAA